MARTPVASPPGLIDGDRVVYLGLGQRHGRHGSARSPRREFSGVDFDDGHKLLCRTVDLHPIPRRPPPMF